LEPHFFHLGFLGLNSRFFILIFCLIIISSIILIGRFTPGDSSFGKWLDKNGVFLMLIVLYATVISVFLIISLFELLGLMIVITISSIIFYCLLK